MEGGAGLHEPCVLRQAHDELMGEAHLTDGARSLDGSEGRGRAGERLGGG